MTVRYGNSGSSKLGYSSSYSGNYYLDVARGLVSGSSVLHKFGLAEDVDTNAGIIDIWDGVANDVGGKINTYTFSSTADIGEISSSSTADTQLIYVEGLDSNWDLVKQYVTLNGRSAVSLETPLLRVFRAYNAGTVDQAGVIYVYTTGSTLSGGRPDDDENIRAIVHQEAQQTQMAIYTVPNGKALYITEGWMTISKQSTTEVVGSVWVRSKGGVFRRLHSLALQTSGTSSDHRPYQTPLPLSSGTDIMYKAQSYSNNTAVAAGFHAILEDT